MVKFDWTGFNEENMREANACKDEDEIFGDILLEVSNFTAYLIDIHHTYYSSRDKFFDLEVYEATGNDDEGWGHGEWLGYINDIKTATDYNRFCRKAERLIIKFLLDMVGNDEDEEDDKHEEV